MLQLLKHGFNYSAFVLSKLNKTLSFFIASVLFLTVLFAFILVTFELISLKTSIFLIAIIAAGTFSILFDIVKIYQLSVYLRQHDFNYYNFDFLLLPYRKAVSEQQFNTLSTVFNSTFLFMLITYLLLIKHTNVILLPLYYQIYCFLAFLNVSLEISTIAFIFTFVKIVLQDINKIKE